MNSTNEEYFELDRWDSEVDAFLPLAEPGPGQSNFLDRFVEPFVDYDYRIRGVQHGGMLVLHRSSSRYINDFEGLVQARRAVDAATEPFRSGRPSSTEEVMNRVDRSARGVALLLPGSGPGHPRHAQEPDTRPGIAVMPFAN